MKQVGEASAGERDHAVVRERVAAERGVSEMSARQEYAVTITAREQAELLPIERDSRPLGPREVAGRTLATLVSAGTELASAYQGADFPRVPGYAAVFEIEAAGTEVTGLEVGERAF